MSEEKKVAEKKGLVNVPLIPLKITLFCWYAAGACLLPYMTLHMKQLGLTVFEMTIIYAVLPMIQLLGTPIAGFIADKMGNYKPVLLISLGTCIVTTSLIQIVPGRKAPEPDDSDETLSADSWYMLTFWIYISVRIFHQVAVGLSYVLLDTTAIVLSEEHGSSYGRQRFWAILATGIFSPICGFIIDHISVSVDAETGNIINNYAPAFYFFNVLTAITFIKATMITVTIPEIPTNVWKNIRPLLKTANVWLFLLSIFVMGSCWGFLESFLFLHLQKLDAPNYLMGLTLTVGAFVGLPFLYESEWFINKFGAVPILLVALVVYFIRLIGYSLIVNPWWCIPFEVMEAFTLHLMWVATVKFAYCYSPPGMLASLQAVVGGLNFGVGRGFGSLVGGIAFALFGARVAFRVVGCLALIMAIIYGICYQLFLKKDIIKDRRISRRRQVENGSDNINNDESSQETILKKNPPVDVKFVVEEKLNM